MEDSFEIVNEHAFGIPAILRTSIERFVKMRGAEGAASISFFMIFSIPPLIILFVSITSYFLKVEDIQHLLIQLVEESIPITTQDLIVLLNQIINRRESLGIIGLIGLVWSSSGFLMTLTANIDRAFPNAKRRNAIENRMIAFFMVAILILLLAVSSVFSTLFSVFSKVEITVLPFDPSWRTVSHFGLVFIRFLLFLALYAWVPKKPVRTLAVIWAAGLASLTWELTALGFGWYLGEGVNYYNVLYGSLGTLVAFMFWIYINLVITIFAACLCAAIDENSNLNRQVPHQTAQEANRY
jgi:membrane protein